MDGMHYLIDLVKLKAHLIQCKMYNNNIQFIDDDTPETECAASNKYSDLDV